MISRKKEEESPVAVAEPGPVAEAASGKPKEVQGEPKEEEKDSRALAKDYARKEVPQVVDELRAIKGLGLSTLDYTPEGAATKTTLQNALQKTIQDAWLKGYSYALHRDERAEADKTEKDAQKEAKAKNAPPK